MGLLVVTLPQGSAGPAYMSEMIPSNEHHGEFCLLNLKTSPPGRINIIGHIRLANQSMHGHSLGKANGAIQLRLAFSME